jgi:hypothetical protein
VEAEDPRLTRMAEICAALPEVERQQAGRHATFRVRKKTFAYYLDDHRGDEGIVGAVFKAHPGQNEALIAGDPARFYLPAYVGPRGWAGLRLDTPEVDWDDVEHFLTEAYLLTAPKRLASQVDAPGR